MEKLIGENDNYMFYNWVSATEWARITRGNLKAYNWHVLTVYNKQKELQGVHLIDSDTNNFIYDFNSRNLEEVCCMIDVIKLKMMYE